MNEFEPVSSGFEKLAMNGDSYRGSVLAILSKH